MGRALVKLADDEYVEWSTVVDAPLTYIVSRDEAVKEWGDERVERADEQGHSFIDYYWAPGPPEVLIRGNRAGKDETELTLDELREQYRDG